MAGARVVKHFPQAVSVFPWHFVCCSKKQQQFFYSYMNILEVGSTERDVLTLSRLSVFLSFQEYESLEQENTSLKREIVKLTDEMKHLSEVLKDHEKICPLLHCTMNFVTVPRPDALTSCLPR